MTTPIQSKNQRLGRFTDTVNRAIVKAIAEYEADVSEDVMNVSWDYRIKERKQPKAKKQIAISDGGLFGEAQS